MVAPSPVRTGIATHALAFAPHREGSERREFDGLAPRERGANLFQHIFDHLRGLIARESNRLKDRFRQVGARQSVRSHGTTP